MLITTLESPKDLEEGPSHNRDHVVIVLRGPSSYPCGAATRPAWVGRATRAGHSPERMPDTCHTHQPQVAEVRTLLQATAVAARAGRAKQAKLNSIIGPRTKASEAHFGAVPLGYYHQLPYR